MDTCMYNVSSFWKSRVAGQARSAKSCSYLKTYRPMSVPYIRRRKSRVELSKLLKPSLVTVAVYSARLGDSATIQAGAGGCESQEEYSNYYNVVAAKQLRGNAKKTWLALSAFLGSLALTSGAWAGDLDVADSEAFIGSTYDPVVTVVFGIIVLCLVIVTGGVRPSL